MSNDASSLPPEATMPPHSTPTPPDADPAPDASTTSNPRSSLHYSLLGPSLLKAGQDGVDQNAISEIIYAASVGSKYFAHESRRDEALTARISALLRKKAELEVSAGGAAVLAECRKVDAQLEELDRGRDLSQVIVHVDCDAFFASVEELYNPELKNVPMAVGGGVLSTCNYKARQFGVRSGMASHIAKKVCPQLVMVKPNFERYNSKAVEIRAVLEKYDERYEAASVDEAYLNITKYLQSHPEFTPESLVEQIRAEVLETTKVSVSAGIAPNAKIAKIASNQNKPNGQFRVPNTKSAVMTFMSTLPVRKVNGIGRVFERELAAVGIKTCGDIYAARGILRALFGVKARDFLLSTYLGLGRTAICRADEYERKSIGTERTFADLGGAGKLREKLRRTAEELEKELGNTHDVVGGRTLVLKVKLHTYEVLTRQRNLARPVATAEELYTNALPLLVALESEYPGLKIRLLGLRVTHLVPRREKVDVMKWFFGNKQPGQQKRKAPELDEDGWEVWPEEEFEHAQLKEREEELQLTQELQEELEAREKEGKGKGKEEPPSLETWECPICGSHQPADDTRFNQHMDFCLSKEAIRSAVRESSRTSEGPPPQKKKKQLVFPGPSKR